MKRFILMFVAAIFCHHAFSQYQGNNWVFGDSAGLDFSSNPPSPWTSKISTLETAASISDNSGNLLFYTNGEKVWNKDNLIMQNGDSLLIANGNYNQLSTITQGVIIVPNPKSDGTYYIFHLQKGGDFPALRYSIADMNLDAGFGGISVKNITLIEDFFLEKMQVIKHGNGRDWWIVVYKYPDLEDGEIFENGDMYVFTKFLLTSIGIEGPFFQTFGAVYDLTNFFSYWGQMKFNSSGTKLMCAMGKDLDIYNFDRCTGEFSNYININDVDTIGLYGAEFSSDGSKLYVSSADDTASTKKVYQYCLDCGFDVAETKQVVFEQTNKSYTISQMQLGIDDRIYIGSLEPYNALAYSDVNTHLYVINSPNEEGLICNYDTLTISLGGKRNVLCLPNMPNYNLGPLVGSECDTLETSINSYNDAQKLSIYPNPASDHIFISGVNSASKVLHLEMYNAIGELVLVKGKFDMNTKIDLSVIGNGIYALIIKDGDLMIDSEKLIVIKNK